jgi:putative transposase
MVARVIGTTLAPARHHPAHPSPVERHNQPIIVLLTVATVNRRPILAEESAHEALRHAWASAVRWGVGYYMILPDHIHLFCSPQTRERDTVKSWCAYWKRLAGMEAPTLKGAFVWDCWDTQMRDREHYLRKLEYVTQNPVRRGLVQAAGEWAFQGHLQGLPW